MEQGKHAEIGQETSQWKQAEMEKEIAREKQAEIEQVMLQRREMEQGKSAMCEHVTVTEIERAMQLQENPLRGLKQTADCAVEVAAQEPGRSELMV